MKSGVIREATTTRATQEQLDAGAPARFYICGECDDVIEVTPDGGFCNRCRRPVGGMNLSEKLWDRQREAFEALRPLENDMAKAGGKKRAK